MCILIDWKINLPFSLLFFYFSINQIVALVFVIICLFIALEHTMWMCYYICGKLWTNFQATRSRRRSWKETKEDENMWFDQYFYINPFDALAYMHFNHLRISFGANNQNLTKKNAIPKCWWVIYKCTSTQIASILNQSRSN